MGASAASHDLLTGNRVGIKQTKNKQTIKAI
jgi:hypothetical protein